MVHLPAFRPSPTVSELTGTVYGFGPKGPIKRALKDPTKSSQIWNKPSYRLARCLCGSPDSHGKQICPRATISAIASFDRDALLPDALRSLQRNWPNLSDDECRQLMKSTYTVIRLDLDRVVTADHRNDKTVRGGRELLHSQAGNRDLDSPEWQQIKRSFDQLGAELALVATGPKSFGGVFCIVVPQAKALNAIREERMEVNTKGFIAPEHAFPIVVRIKKAKDNKFDRISGPRLIVKERRTYIRISNIENNPTIKRLRLYSHKTLAAGSFLVGGSVGAAVTSAIG